MDNYEKKRLNLNFFFHKDIEDRKKKIGFTTFNDFYISIKFINKINNIKLKENLIFILFKFNKYLYFLFVYFFNFFKIDFFFRVSFYIKKEAFQKSLIMCISMYFFIFFIFIKDLNLNKKFIILIEFLFLEFFLWLIYFLKLFIFPFFNYRSLGFLQLIKV